MKIPSETTLLEMIENNELSVTPIYFDQEGFGINVFSHWEILSKDFLITDKTLKVALLKAYAKLNQNGVETN